MNAHHWCYYLLGCFVVVTATLSKSDKKKSSKSKSATPVQETVDTTPRAPSHLIDLGLMQQSLNVDNLLKHSKDEGANVKHFSGKTLAFVTPWNGAGYDVASKYNAKFDYVSPVWLQWKPGCVISGQHDVDTNWMARVRGDRLKGTKIVPRLIIEGYDMRTLHSEFVNNDAGVHACLRQISDLVAKYNFDGIVLEFWRQGGIQLETLNGGATHIYNDLAAMLESNDAELLAVLPPPTEHSDGKTKEMYNSFIANTFGRVSLYVIMTYDYNEAMGAAPIAPMYWLMQCLRMFPKVTVRQRLLFGANVYGRRSSTNKGQEPMVGSDFLREVRMAGKQLRFDETSQEHYGVYSDKERGDVQFFFPTPYTLGLRLDKFEDERLAGVALWEVGQTYDLFFHLL